MTYSLLTDYGTHSSAYDETRAHAAQLAPHWQDFDDHMARLGAVGVERLQLEVQRLLQENGVTYTVHGAPDGHQRPWALDIVPLIFSAEEWRTIEAGVLQRAELLNIILTDLYGAQTLLKEGLLPLEVAYSDPAFLRPCHGFKLAGNHQLILYATDLARGPDRRMWVVGDRTQAPSGSGYALENRTIMSQAQRPLFREGAFRGGKVSRLSSYFRDLQTTLARLAPRLADAPRVVVMTPGPHNETYFEHAYLASYLGYTLVQGSDLSVHNGGVSLKTLSGLQPVDTIYRRVDDTFCDPLELRPESQLGVTGLVEAARRGQVAVVNPLGSGLLENPGIIPFLSGIARSRLGEELILPMAATWWCGQPRECSYVLENLGELIIKPISGPQRQAAIVGERLSAAERQQLAAQIRSQPYRYVGQQPVGYSTAPTFVSGKMAPRSTILRTFALAREHDYTVMPGGLTRSATVADDLAVSSSQGGISKDTWVLTRESQQHVSLWLRQPDQIVEAYHSAESLPSRAAENLFWVGRYLERADGSTRLLRTILDCFSTATNLDDRNESLALRQLLIGLTQVTNTYPGFVGEESEARRAHPTAELLSFILEPDRQGGLYADLCAMDAAAYAVRNLWSLDAWRVLQEIEAPWAQMAHQLDAAAQEGRLADIRRELNRLITQLMALVGLYSDNMTHNAGWLMLEIGRRLERGLRTAALIRALLVVQQPSPVEHLLMEAALRTTDNIITYRRRYRSHLQLQTVLDLLLLDEANPRSLLWQLNSMHGHLAQLPRTKMPYRLSREEQTLLRARTRLQLCNTAELVGMQKETVLRQALDDLMADLATHLTELSTVLTESYFIHTQVQQQFGAATWNERVNRGTHG